MFNQSEYEERQAKIEALKIEASKLGIPMHIKHANRWCRLREINGQKLIYAAPAKQNRTRFMKHQPVDIEKTISEVMEQR